jgi:8-oxo-dGTP pyrophosphatase MutT (NUDIX family)
MPISPYLRELRAHIGTTRVLMPSVSAHVFDEQRRLLLVRQKDDGAWSTPGGSIEPDERPADAVVRETWEETGLLVTPQRLLSVYGGPEFVVRYPNGDEVQYVLCVFTCTVTGGRLRDASDETEGARFFSEAEARQLPLSPWLRSVLPRVYAEDVAFDPPTWTPNASP